MREFAEVLITGVTIGIVYFLVAVGFTLCYGVGRVLNYSYGSFFTWGAYLAWVLAVGYADLSYFLVFAIVLPIMFFFGVAVDQVLIRPLRKRRSSTSASCWSRSVSRCSSTTWCW